MKLLHKIKTLLSNLPLFVISRITKTPDQVRNNVPYVSQFANPSWVEMVLKDNQPIARDYMWEESGARSIKEYERWVLAICGMACTVMLLKFYKKGDFKTILLARDSAKLGVYKKDGDGISSMQFKPYKKWIKKFGIKAKIHTRLSFRSICYLLSKKRLIIASVNPNLRGYNTAPKMQVGGHLILITGYNKKEKTVTFHDPAGFENNNSQSNHTMQWKEFIIYFTERGITVRNLS